MIAVVVYLLFYYESLGFLTIAIILSLYILAFYEHYSKVDKTRALLMARLSAINTSCQALMNFTSTKNVSSDKVAGNFFRSLVRDLRSDIKNYLALGDISPDLLSHLPVDTLIALDKLKIDMLGTIDYIDDAGDFLNSKSMGENSSYEAHELCERLIATMAPMIVD